MKMRFTAPTFWRKIRRFAALAGREVVSKALLLYYCYADPKTPPWVRAVILGALGYFVNPLDAIPDTIPLAGFADDLGALAAAAALVTAHVRRAHADAARKKLGEWFRTEA